MPAKKSDKTVLIIADREENRQVALGRGFHLAEALGCKAHVVAFFHESLASLKDSNPEIAERVQKDLLKHRSESLARQLEKHQHPGLKVTSEVVWSKRVHEWVEDACKKNPPVAVVKTGHRSETFAYTPTDWHLIRDCSAPTLIVSDKKWRKTRPVVAAVDLATRSRSKQKLNEKVIETSRKYAEALGCPLYLVHAVHISPVLTELDLIDEHTHTRELKEKLEPKVKKLAAKYDIAEKNIILKRGPASKVIVSESARVKAQLLVIGTVGRKGARAKFLGNTAEEVLMLIHTDVLTLKP